MQTNNIGMHEEIDRWIVAESGTGASKLQEVQEAMDRWNVTEHSDMTNDHQDVLEATSRWNVTEHSGAASCHQDAEANASWKDVGRIRSKKGIRMYRGM